jgi:(5-formylfuran-3-yl)methyl phosphate synthase
VREFPSCEVYLKIDPLDANPALSETLSGNPATPITQQNGSFVTLNLLVSVQDLTEAKMVVAEKVDWIDLKDPLSGSLGRPSRETLATVGAFLHNQNQRSVALGELSDLPLDYVEEAVRWFPFVKVGLSGQLTSTDSWRTRLAESVRMCESLGSSLVPVMYADHLRCQAPPIQDIFDFARESRCKYLLIDTFFKDGKSLLNWIGPFELFKWNQQAQDSGIGLVLAGSIRQSDLPSIVQCNPAAIAVRSAVCTGPRTGSISREKLVRFQRLLQEFNSPSKTTN